MVGSQKWGYIRIIAGTILGGVLGFYVMHRVEVGYKVLSLSSVFLMKIYNPLLFWLNRKETIRISSVKLYCCMKNMVLFYIRIYSINNNQHNVIFSLIRLGTETYSIFPSWMIIDFFSFSFFTSGKDERETNSV